MQIIWRATTATTAAAGAVITTLNTQVLPAWAPPIQYVGTTDPWLCMFMGCTTYADGGFAGTKSKPRFGQVRAYGRRATLNSGRECFATSHNTHGGVKTERQTFYVFTYRAIGEIARP